MDAHRHGDTRKMNLLLLDGDGVGGGLVHYLGVREEGVEGLEGEVL